MRNRAPIRLVPWIPPTRTAPTPYVSKRGDYKRVFTISAVAVVVLLATVAILSAIKWPFTMAKMQKELATETSGMVQIHGFRTREDKPAFETCFSGSE